MLKKTLLLGSTFMMVAAAPALAQDQDENFEIITTATKRAQTLQDTPVAVTVTSALEIERANIRDIKDLQSVVPSLVVTTNQNSAQSTFTIRGFGNGANNTGLEPSVGVFVDGVYRSRPSSAIGDLPKLERVEVLSGPQSTLFGKNASAGVVSIVTAKPEFDFNGSVQGTYGNFNNINLRADVTGPLSDNVAYSLSGGYNSQDGYAEAFSPGLPDVNDRNRFNLRGQLLWEPNDVASIRFIADYSEIDEICCHVTNLQNGPTAAIITSPVLGGALADPNDEFAFVDYRDVNPSNEIKDYGLSMHVDYDLGFAEVTSITAYRDNDSFNVGDVDFTTAVLVEEFRDNRLKTFTQELRLTSTGDGPFSWLIGGFYFNEDADVTNGLDYGEDTRNYLDFLGAGFAGLEAASGGILAPGSSFADDTTTREFFTQKNEAFNLFGNFDYEITDRLTATVGLAYVDDSKTITGRTVNTDVFGNANLTGDFGTNVLTAGGLAANFGAFQSSCLIDPANPAGGFLSGLAFPDGVPTIFGTQCFVPGTGFVPGQAAFGGFQTQVATGSAALAQTVNNPLLALAGFQFQPQFLPFGGDANNPLEDGRSNDTNVDYTLKLGYEFTDSFNAYVSYATGYKATSWNLGRDSRPSIDNAAALYAGGLLPNNYRFQLNDGSLISNASTATVSQADINVASPFNANFGSRFSEPEEAEVFEIGVKTKFEWGYINLAAFDQSITNFQTNGFRGTAFVFTNAEKQSTKGIELDSMFRLDDNFTGTFSMTLLDPKYDSFTNSVSGDISGETVAGVPKVSFSVGANWDFQLNDDIDGYIRGDFEHQSSTRIIQQYNLTDQVDRLNASVGFNKDAMSLAFWARNLTNDQEYQVIFPGVIQSFPGQVPTINGYPARPRTYGVTAKYRFGSY